MVWELFVRKIPVCFVKRKITYGVPQGSVLGPTLFNIHKNGISNVCENSDVVLYADDTEIHASSQEVNIAKQCVEYWSWSNKCLA